MSKATEGVLGELHELVARVLAERLGNPELCSAADINAAIKFLKDNNITCISDADNALGELESNLAELKKNTPEDQDLQAALDNVSFMEQYR